jgi:alanyl-tRNA synthetase
VDDEIRHFGDSSAHLLGQNVSCSIDQERRLSNARYHTAGHLLANITENLYKNLIPTKCHAFPHEAYIEFPCDGTVPDLDELQAALNRYISSGMAIKVFETDKDSFEKNYYKLPYEIPDSKNFRVLQIGDYKPVPCGGTHLSGVGEIGSVTIKKAKIKNNILKISYEVT